MVLLVLAPRRLWNLSRLAETEPLALFQSRFRSLVAPLRDTLAGLVDCPPASCPSIDSLNESLNNCLYQAMDESIGSKASRPGHWMKYWKLLLVRGIACSVSGVIHWVLTRPIGGICISKLTSRFVVLLLLPKGSLGRTSVLH